MTLVVQKGNTDSSVLKDVERISGVNIGSCLQCKKCTNGCPLTVRNATPPSEVIRRLQFHGDESVLNSELVWTCVSCELCYSRCPMQIDMSAVMDALRIIAVKKNVAKHKGNIPLFNRLFLKTVRLFGRTYDLGMIAAYKAGTSSYLQDTEKFPMMLKKRKIALFPSFKADKKYLKNIFRFTKNGKNDHTV
jgi:heterodisulfide reductase subunit C2